MIIEGKLFKEFLSVLKNTTGGGQCGYLRFSDNSISASSGGTTIVIEFPEPIGFDAIVPISVLVPLVKEYKEIVSIERVEDNLVLMCGRNEATVGLANHFKHWQQIQPSNDMVAVPEGLFEGLTLGLTAIAKSEKRPQFNGIGIDGKRLMASDSQRVFWYELEAELVPGDDIMLPRELVTLVTGTKLLSNPSGVYFGETYCSFRFDCDDDVTITVSGSYANATFPSNWLDFFPDDCNLHTITMSSSVIGTLKRMASMENVGSGSDSSVFTLNEDKMNLQTQRTEIRVVETVDLDPPLVGDPITFSTKASYILWAFDITNGVFGLSTTSKAVYCESEEKPIRILVSME